MKRVIATVIISAILLASVLASVQASFGASQALYSSRSVPRGSYQTFYLENNLLQTRRITIDLYTEPIAGLLGVNNCWLVFYVIPVNCTSALLEQNAYYPETQYWPGMVWVGSSVTVSTNTPWVKTWVDGVGMTKVTFIGPLLAPFNDQQNAYPAQGQGMKSPADTPTPTPALDSKVKKTRQAYP